MGQESIPQIITDGIHGDVPINFYPASDSEKGVILQPTMGLSTHCQLTNCTEVRGLWTFPPNMYALARRGSNTVLWRVAADGTFVELGTISTSFTGPTYLDNSTTQMLICDSVSGYVYTPGTGVFQQITDVDFPGASTCTAQDGYALFTQPNSRTWFHSSLYDFTAFDALDFYVKEGKPDNVQCIRSLLREPWVMGQKSIEVWTNTGGSGAAATFQRVPGGLIEYGLGAVKSAEIVNSKMTWLSDKRQLLQAVAYQPKVVSNQMFERAISGDPNTPGYPIFSDAIAYTFTEQNHTFYVLTFPSGDETWVWDETTGMFFKWRSYSDSGLGYGRHRSNCYTLYNNEHYVGDYSNGKIYKMSGLHLDDAGQKIRREFYIKPLDNSGKLVKFPDLEVIVKSGVGLSGTGDGSDPQIMLQFSEDQGETWTNEAWRSAGKIGEHGKKITWTEMGEGYWRMYRIAVSDAVFWQIQGVSYGGR